MATTIMQAESKPDSYPNSPFVAATYQPGAKAIWQRIESYTAHRWSERDVVWTVEGPGEWHPPLVPATIELVEIWESLDGWVETFDLSPSPYGGFYLPGCGPYRFTGTVGAGSPAPEVPEAVIEAFKRLAEYMASDPGTAGARSEAVDIGTISTSVTRSESWMARAMANSGAGDLLRPYRRAP